MSESPQDREGLIRGLNEATRESSTWTILFHQAIADRVKLNITDHKALDILSHQAAQELGPLFEHFQQQFLPLLRDYSEQDLELLSGYFKEAARIMHAKIAWLREEN